jgi:hypothetical protein
MTPEQVQAWLDRYIEAWHSYHPQQITNLFSEAAVYLYHPWDEPLRGSKAIVDSWLDDQDPPGSWEASYRPLMINGNRAIATGETVYSRGDIYWNIWELDFDEEGKCSRFVEWFMLQP